MKIYKVAIIGGGPAGLSAAITAGSELSDVVLIDSGKHIKRGESKAPILGGQIRETARIVNHPGVMEASGKEFIDILKQQAEGMGVEIRCPEHVASLRIIDGDLKEITTQRGEKIITQAVIVASGLSYRKLPKAVGAERYYGDGFQYGAMDVNPCTLGTCNIGIIGAANSAAQAVMKLAENTDANIHIYVRGLKTIKDQMSAYLVRDIEANPRITVVQDVEVIDTFGAGRLQKVRLKKGDGTVYDEPCDHLFAFIGAVPKGDWMPDCLARDNRGYILTGDQLGETAGFKPLPFETSMSGVFAAGDVLKSPNKRVTISTGHGSSAVATLHRYLAAIHNGDREPTRVKEAA